MGITELVSLWEEEKEDSINSGEWLEMEVWCNLFSKESSLKDKQLIFSVMIFRWWVKSLKLSRSLGLEDKVWDVFMESWICDVDKVVWLNNGWINLGIEGNGKSWDHILWMKWSWNEWWESLNK